jgi:hypothetical protein
MEIASGTNEERRRFRELAWTTTRSAKRTQERAVLSENLRRQYREVVDDRVLIVAEASDRYG